ncbi:MAG: hypothetical protein LBG19_09040 [Prevotellaceae bacterium]|jgi:hypothetical protein|nr:hypothetical protein [Prevotellaceae bacterium]
MKRIRLLFPLVFLFILSANTLSGQYVSYGTDAWGQRWQQITTPHFKFIYPKPIDSLAQQYAWLLDTIYAHGSKSIGHTSIRIPVVLHPDNVYSNGMVTWAPSRMELITTPPAEGYSQPWSKHLSLHEFRHVAQIDKLNKGFTRIAYYLFGEHTSGLWLLPIPKWFLEGDAVATETALSSSGRGRDAKFHMAYRAYLLSDIDWTYDRWINGSYKHNVPNIYHFGYENVAYARYKYGVDIWDKVLDESARSYFKFPAFSNALKKHTGLKVKDLQKEVFAFLQQQWIEEDRLLKNDTSLGYLTPEDDDYTSYRSIVPLSGTTFIAIKESMSRASGMIMVNDEGKEEQLINHGAINGRITRYRGKIYWSENVSAPRWEQRSYANVKSLDLKSKQVTKHTRKGRYFNLAFNDSLSHYAATTIGREGVSGICLLDSNSDAITNRHNTPLNSRAIELAWINTTGMLAVLLLNDEGMGIYSLNINSGEWSTLLPELYVNISGISVFDGYVLFESGHSGINNIYALNIGDKKIYKVTSSRFGAFDVNISRQDNRLYFSDYQKKGFRLAYKNINPSEWEEVDWNKPYRFVLADSLSIQESFNIDSVTVPTGKLYESKPYRKALHLFRPHSRMPLYVELDSEVNFDPDELIQSVKPGFMLLSQNSLSTAVARVGYSYEHGYSAGHASFTYRGWYPVIDITASYGGGKQLLITEGTLSKGSKNLYDIGANIYIPLTLNGTRSLSGLIPQVSIKHNNDSYYVPSEDDYQSQTRLDLFLQHYTYSRSSVRDIYPRWGYRVLFAHRSMPFDTENFGSTYGGRLTVYTPGLFINHGLKLSGTFQQQNVKRYYMSNVFSRPRGYNDFVSKEMKFFSADYAFPIAYPDFNIGSLLYFKRFRLNLFTDIGQNSYYGREGVVTTNLFSYGLDIIADYHIMRKEFPFMTGIRLIKPRNNNLSAEILFNVTF